MKHELRLTDIGEGLEEAEIITWLVEVGDEVVRDQPIVEVMTDKSNAELPAPSAGTIVALGEAVGSMIHVGDLLAVIDASPQPDATEDTAPPPASSGSSSPGPSSALPLAALRSPPSPAVATDGSAQVRVKASPSTRRAASERGIDLTTITGSGPGGRILLSDLDQTGATPTEPSASASTTPTASTPASTTPQPTTPITSTSTSPITTASPGAFSAATAPPQPTTPITAQPTTAQPTGSQRIAQRPSSSGAKSDLAGITEPLRGVRRAIAKNMAQSWSEIPHIHAFEQIDAEPLLALRARLRGTETPAYATLTPLGFFVAAVARALQAFPQANASLDMEAGTISIHPEINLGVAVAAPQGLVVPVLQDAGSLDFETISASLTQLIAAARDGNLAPAHYKRGTATITNFGSLGGEQATPLIRPPESVIIGFGSIDVRPFVIDDEVVARKTMHLVIGADHRLLDGDITTAVLNHIAESLRDPLGLVL